MVLPILTFPHPVLRANALPVTFPLNATLRKLTADMFDTVRRADGIGLAAPQVGQSVRLVVINLEKNGVPAFALYNPRIVKRSLRKLTLEEGCLSIPGIFGMVRRPKRVTVEAENAQGETVRFTDDGWIARVAQHEIDHINGKLIVDIITRYTQGDDQVRAWRAKGLLQGGS